VKQKGYRDSEMPLLDLPRARGPDDRGQERILPSGTLPRVSRTVRSEASDAVQGKLLPLRPAGSGTEAAAVESEPSTSALNRSRQVRYGMLKRTVRGVTWCDGRSSRSCG
jgi:hypothetical protein